MEKYYVDWGKLAQVFMLLAATVAMALSEVIPGETVALVLGGAVGYVFGNGKSARSGEPVAPLIGVRRQPEVPEGE